MEQQELIHERGELIPAKPNGQAALVAQPPTPMDLLQIATSQGANVETLAKLMDLQERWEANQARKAFNAAMAEFKKNPPQINKNKHVEFGNTKYDHATLDHVADAIGEGLSKVGVRFRWETSQTPAIAVTCVLEGFGHEERTTLSAPADTSGSKNGIQAIASTVTYLERYTLLAACGLAARGSDDDGKGSGMPDGWLAERLDWIANCNASELQKTFTEAYKEAKTAKATKAMTALIDAKDLRKKQVAA